MSDSGRVLGDCRHNQTPAYCWQCLTDEVKRLQAALTVKTMHCAQAKELLRKLHAILRHKHISPPMWPGVQQAMEDECAAAIQALEG